MFADAPQRRTGKTRLPSAGAAADEGKLMKRWGKFAGLNEGNEQEARAGP